MDSITGLPPRSEAFQRLEATIQAAAGGNRLIIALIDLVQFYSFVEARQTRLADRIVRTVASRLKEALPAGAVLCRYSGSAFLVSFETGADEGWGKAMLENLRHAAEVPIEQDGAELHLTACCGAAVYPKDGTTFDQLLVRSESALYRAKERGGGRLTLYEAKDAEPVSRHFRLDASLRPALYRKQLHVSYQPIYRTDNGRLKGLEALLRWDHPELGAIPPREFIPIAERNGMIVPIGEWVIREACRRIERMNRYGPSELVAAANVSEVQLADPRFPEAVLYLLNETNLDPSRLELEISVNAMMDIPESAAVALAKLRSAGVRIALDDFGEGYSSLAQLRQLPASGLKIDKSFIRHIHTDSAERSIVESVIDMAHRLGLEVTAEGVEFEEQYRQLRDWGCEYVQGYLLGKPKEPGVLDLSMMPSLRERETSLASVIP